MLPTQYALQHPTRTLLSVFVAWKAALLLIAAGSCVGPTYDTSSDLLLSSPDGRLSAFSSDGTTAAGDVVGLLARRLTSWDAIYFVQVSRRGYLFEQEWAFGSGLPLVIAAVRKGLEALGFPPDRVSAPLLGILVAHTSHLLSVLVLYQLGLLVLGSCLPSQSQDTRARTGTLALVGALLHVISPAGLFLSAPCAESPFALLSFVGFFLFARGHASASPARRDASYLAAGLSFGLATAFRTNGVLNGILFAYPFLREVLGFLSGELSFTAIRKTVVLSLGGLLVAAGSVIPQAWAYQTYCMSSGSSGSGTPPRPWCHGTVPSIYNFVQKQYWGTGFLHYWTLSNLPLFLLAVPVLSILIKSGVDTLTLTVTIPKQQPPLVAQKARPPTMAAASLASVVGCMAAGQLALAVLTLFTYHVQIITRLSSGYPVWYWWVARSLLPSADGGGGHGGGTKPGTGGLIVGFMVMYAAIQGVLFASFLPPA